MKDDIRLCMGCMNELGEDGVCHYCTYTDDIPHLQSYLAPHTVLNDRYIVGKMLSYNGEGASYICYDTVARTKAVMREYMPDTLCERSMNSEKIVINPDCLAKYKTYMAEFQDMNNTLTKTTQVKGICAAKEMFTANNTAYVVMEYIDGVSLKKFLQANRGYLQWSQVKKLFVPLFTTLSIIHNAGIIHRGISPENIIVTTEGKLKLTGFSISSIRTAGTGLSPEFYSGYTAPEQYSSLEWQGTWTDVYSIAAVIYRILTGYVPPDANSRLRNDTMIPASRINPHIPRHVSSVLMRAMSVKGPERIQNITDLVSELFENVPQPSTHMSSHVKGATQTIPVVKPKNNEDTAERRALERELAAAKEARKKTTTALTAVGLLLLGLLLIVGIYLLYQVFSPQEESSSEPMVVTNAIDDGEDSEILIPDSKAVTLPQEESMEESPYGTGAIMPNLVGQRYDAVERELGSSFTIRTKTYYSELDGKGIVTAQSIPAGVEYDPEKQNKLVLDVCLGPPTVPVPEFEDLPKKTYLDMLNSLNIKYSTVEEDSYTVKEGYVTRTNLDPGYLINIESGEVLIVYISKGVPEDSSSLDSGDESGNESSEGEYTDWTDESSDDYTTDQWYDNNYGY